MQPQAVVIEKRFAQSEAKFDEIIAMLESAEARQMTHSELETKLEADGREVLRLLYQDHLDLRGMGEADGEVVGADGDARTHRRPSQRPLTTVFGPVVVRRIAYAARSNANLHPRDAELNLPRELHSHGVRRRVAEEAAKNSFDETVASVGKTTGAAIAKRQAEELVQRAAVDFDSFYAERQVVPSADAAATGSILVITADGKGVVMRTEDLRSATRKAAESRKHKISKRLSKGEKRNAKRMATVAAVYTIDPFVRAPLDIVSELRRTIVKCDRPRPESKRVWASLEKTPEEVITAAFDEAAHRDPTECKRWVALVDGNLTQLDLLKKIARQRGVELTIIVDIIHVIEYLWDAAYVFHDDGTQAAQDWVTVRLLEILNGNASHVAAGIRRSATLRCLDADDRKPADDCAGYLLKYKRFLRYDQYLMAGFPIATGVIEGACRHLIKDRLDITGARWSLAGAEAVLRLRSLRSSRDFDEYWCFHEKRELERNHAAQYAGGIIPRTQSPKLATTRGRGHLRVVK